jgi:outer membrane receptor protein involved in Fe transport
VPTRRLSAGRASLALTLALPAFGSAAAALLPADPSVVPELPPVAVVVISPLAGTGLPMNEVAANVQVVDAADLLTQQTHNLADYLNDNFSGVSLSDNANNPFQMDVNYHGFTASPLLGTPQGLSVYVDGVRVNESFGDTVNWDLIPESAIASATLVSGSNPVFGLNTLGGALSVRTKSGRDDPDTELEGSGGSFGRRTLEAETGGSQGAFDYYLSGSYFDEVGWRDVSPSTVYQGFAKAGWHDEVSDLHLSYTYADTTLYGDGATPVSLLDYRRQATYTPDLQQNRMNFFNLTGTRTLTDHVSLAGDAYVRDLATFVNDGNTNDNYLVPSYSPEHAIDCALPGATLTSLAYCLGAQNALSPLTQRSAGFGLQLTDARRWSGWRNQATAGVEYSDARDAFAQESEYGTFAANRTLVYVPSPYNDETVISLSGINRIEGLYLTDTFSRGDLVHVTGSLRYNRSTETLQGYSLDTTLGPGFNSSSPLTGDHTFIRLNPALGLTLTPTAALTYYANYGTASREPTVIELGCANPVQPCGLPNDFASDPSLKQVVARTAELGVRGATAQGRLAWSADAYRTISSDDIQFVATTTNQGYFDNVGDTRRQGFDVTLAGRAGGLRWRMAYSLVDATYQSRFTVNAASNSSADAYGNIVVEPGDRIPVIARQMARLVVDYAASSRLDVGATIADTSGAYLHGDENNANRAGGTNAAGATVSPLGSGWIPSYLIVNLRASYRVADNLELFGRVANLLNAQYATDGFLTANVFNPNGTFRANPADWTNENAVSPGVPRGIWAGVRYRVR